MPKEKKHVSDLKSSAPRVLELRNRSVKAQPFVIKKSRGSFRDYNNYIYTSDIGPTSNVNREPMPNSLTSDLLREGRGDPLVSSLAMKVEPLKGGKLKLKEQNVSRNHILADSRIRTILSIIFKVERVELAPKSDALLNFFSSLCGEKVGKATFLKFMDAYRSRNWDAAKVAISIAANGLRNLRLGDAAINTKISNQFDPIVVNGRLDSRSKKILYAVLNLSKNKLISHETALNALAVVKDIHTHQDVTSTVLKSSSIDRETKTRTLIDYFVRSVNRNAFKRRQSTPLVQNHSNDLHPDNSLLELSREVHHSTRPSTLNLDDQQSDSDIYDLSMLFSELPII